MRTIGGRKTNRELDLVKAMEMLRMKKSERASLQSIMSTSLASLKLQSRMDLTRSITAMFESKITSILTFAANYTDITESTLTSKAAPLRSQPF